MCYYLNLLLKFALTFSKKSLIFLFSVQTIKPTCNYNSFQIIIKYSYENDLKIILEEKMGLVWTLKKCAGY
jgi:hypothetical protein